MSRGTVEILSVGLWVLTLARALPVTSTRLPTPPMPTVAQGLEPFLDPR